MYKNRDLNYYRATLDIIYIDAILMVLYVTLTLIGHVTPPSRMRTNPQVIHNLCDKIN